MVTSTSTSTSTNGFSMYSTPMANDYFGSMRYGYAQQMPPQQPVSAPKNQASAILAQYQAAQQGATGMNPAGNYMQKYAMAEMIAKQFSGSCGSTFDPYTSFSKNDIFASQRFPQYGYGVNYYG